jgi:hypothetical protein
MSDDAGEPGCKPSGTDTEELTEIVAEVYDLADVDKSLAARTRIQSDGESVYIPPAALRQIVDRIVKLEDGDLS